jgi:hypothetical protein
MEAEGEDTTAVQLFILILNAVYWVWGIAVLFQDEESRQTPCHAATPMWAYILTTLIVVPVVGLLVVIFRVRNLFRDLDKEARARWDLLLAMAHPLVCCLLAVAGVAMWLAVSEECADFYGQVHPDLLIFFVFQVGFSQLHRGLLSSCFSCVCGVRESQPECCRMRFASPECSRR